MAERTAVLENIFDHSIDGVLLTRPDGRVLRANPAACRALGRSEDEVCRAGREGLVVGDDQLRDLMARREASGSAAGELIFRRSDGSTFPAEFTSGLMPSSDGEPFAYVIFRDITERRRVEEGLRQSNRALRVMTLCSEALVRAKTEEELFAEVCRAVVEAGGYRMCWAGLAEHDAKQAIRPVAHAGYEDGFLSVTDFVWSDAPRGRGPSGTAIRTGAPVVGCAFATDPTLEPWRAEALRRGYGASIALPLVHEGQAIGVITAYSAEVQTFDEAERETLSRLARNLAYGVHALRQASARARAEEALRRSEATLKGITDAIPEPIFLKDREGRWIFANPATLAVAGKPLDQVLGKTDREIYSNPAIGEALREIDRRIMESGLAEVVEETVQAPGGPRVFLSTKAPVRDGGGAVVGLVGVARDITDRKREEASGRERDRAAALEAAIAMLPIAVMVVELTPDGSPRTVTHNAAFDRIVGSVVPKGASATAMPYRIFRPDRITPVPFEEAPGPRAARTGEAVLMPEMHVRRPDGSWRIAAGSAVPVPPRVAGEPRRAVVVLFDVTEERAASAASQESERMLAAALASMTDASSSRTRAGPSFASTKPSRPSIGFQIRPGAPGPKLTTRRSSTSSRSTVLLRRRSNGPSPGRFAGRPGRTSSTPSGARTRARPGSETTASPPFAEETRSSGPWWWRGTSRSAGESRTRCASVSTCSPHRSGPPTSGPGTGRWAIRRPPGPTRPTGSTD